MKNVLISKIESGRRVFGTMLTSTSAHAPQALAGLGLDFMFIDTEHISIDRESVSWMCRTFSAMGIVPIVRIPSPDPFITSMVLDGGAVGVLAPYVETVEQVRALCGAVKYKPLKGDKLARILDGEPIVEDTASYLRKCSGDRLLLINIESGPALENLPELIGVPGLDGIIVGPHDLSVSLDVPEAYQHPKFLAALETIATVARDKLAISGVHFMNTGTAGDATRWMNLGFNLLILHADLVYLRRGLSQDLQRIRALDAENSAFEVGVDTRVPGDSGGGGIGRSSCIQ